MSVYHEVLATCQPASSSSAQAQDSKDSDSTVISSELLEQLAVTISNTHGRVGAVQQVHYFNLGFALVEGKRSVEHGKYEEWCKKHLPKVTESTALRACRFYKLCCEYPGAIGIRGTWRSCHETHTYKELLDAIHALPAGEPALDIWKTLPEWAPSPK